MRVSLGGWWVDVDDCRFGKRGMGKKGGLGSCGGCCGAGWVDNLCVFLVLKEGEKAKAKKMPSLCVEV